MYILSGILGDTYQAKIFEILIENYDEEFSIPEIIEISETSRGSTYSYIKSLVSQGMVIETRKIGGTQLYQLNLIHPGVKTLILLEHNLVSLELEKEIPPEIEKEIEIPRKTYRKHILDIGTVISNSRLCGSRPCGIITYSEPTNLFAQNWKECSELGGKIKWHQI